MKAFRIFYLFFICIFLPDLIAQVKTDSLSFNTQTDTLNNTLTHSHIKYLNTYSLLSGINYKIKSEYFSLSLKDKYSSTIVKSAQKNIKDENYLDFSGFYLFDPYFAGGIKITSNIYNDNRLSWQNNSAINQITAQGEYNSENIILKPFFGFSNNKQSGIVDNGIFYGSGLLINQLMIDDFALNTEALFSNEDISPRRNLNRNLNISISNDQKYFQNTFLFNYLHFYQDYYNLLPADSSVNSYIQNRDEKTYSFINVLTINPDINGFSFDINTQLSFRDVKRNANFFSEKLSSFNFSNLADYRINLTFNSRYQLDNIDLNFSVIYSDKEEKHSLNKNLDKYEVYYLQNDELEKQKNNKAQITTILFSGIWNADKKNRFILNLLHRKLKYDTPSIENYDDRDDLISIARIGYIRKFTPFFDFFVNIEASYNHLVYIFSQLSSNNNQRRFLKFQTGGNYQGKTITSHNTFEVSANYTTYDFSEFSTGNQSYSFRQMFLKDSTGIKLFDKFSFVLKSSIKLSEQGNFNWSGFSTSPVRFLEEIFVEPRIIYFKNQYNFSTGVRYFCLNTFGYKNNEKVLNSEYISLGILMQLNYFVEKNFLKFSYLYEFVNYGQKSKNEIGNMNLEINIAL